MPPQPSSAGAAAVAAAYHPLHPFHDHRAPNDAEVDSDETVTDPPTLLSRRSPERTLHEIFKFRSWRYTATQTQSPPAATASGHLPTIELQVQWVDLPRARDYTWEDEADLQRTAPESVFSFWEHLAAKCNNDRTNKGKARARQWPRSVVLGIEDDTQGVPLRVVDHRHARKPDFPSPEESVKKHPYDRRSRQTARPMNSAEGVRGRGRWPRDDDSWRWRFEWKVEWVGYRRQTWEGWRWLDRGLLEEYWHADDDDEVDE